MVSVRPIQCTETRGPAPSCAAGFSYGLISSRRCGAGDCLRGRPRLSAATPLSVVTRSVGRLEIQSSTEASVQHLVLALIRKPRGKPSSFCKRISWGQEAHIPRSLSCGNRKRTVGIGNCSARRPGIAYQTMAAFACDLIPRLEGFSRAWQWTRPAVCDLLVAVLGERSPPLLRASSHKRYSI